RGSSGAAAAGPASAPARGPGGGGRSGTEGGGGERGGSAGPEAAEPFSQPASAPRRATTTVVAASSAARGRLIESIGIRKERLRCIGQVPVERLRAGQDTNRAASRSYPRRAGDARTKTAPAHRRVDSASGALDAPTGREDRLDGRANGFPVVLLLGFRKLRVGNEARVRLLRVVARPEPPAVTKPSSRPDVVRVLGEALEQRLEIRGQRDT